MFSFRGAKNSKVGYGVFGWILSLVLASYLLIGYGAVSDVSAGLAQAGEVATCETVENASGLAACQRALQDDPQNIDIRIKASDGLVRMRRYAEAVELLRQGLELSPGETIIKQRLSLAESYLQEQLWIEKQQQQRAQRAEKTKGSENDVAARRDIIRCTRLEGRDALRACNEGLIKYPHSAALQEGKGDALSTMNQYGGAIKAYEEAARSGGDKDKISQKLHLVQAKRRIEVKKCRLLEDRRALAACDAALIIGAADEFEIRSRQGDLLLVLGRTQDAVQSYRSALVLRNSDSTVRQKLAALKALPGSEKKPLPSKDPSKVKTPLLPHPKRVTSIVPAAEAKKSAALPPKKPQKPRQENVPQDLLLDTSIAGNQEKHPSPSAADVTQPPIPKPSPARFSNAPEMAGVTH